MVIFSVVAGFAIVFYFLAKRATFQISHIFHLNVVARKRFELLSEAPEAPMLDHYTTGLRTHRKIAHYLLTLMLRFDAAVLLLQRFPHAVAFLTYPVVAGATPKRVNYGVLVVPMSG